MRFVGQDLYRLKRHADLDRLQRKIRSWERDRMAERMFEERLDPAIGIIRAIGWTIVAACLFAIYFMDAIVRAMVS